MSELNNIIEGIGKSFEAFKAGNDGRLGDLENRIESLDIAMGRIGFAGGSFPSAGTSNTGTWVDAKTGKPVGVLAKSDKLAAMCPRPQSGESHWAVADFVRASMGLSIRADATVIERGTSTVPSYVSGNILDMVRAKTRVIEAGAITIPVEGPTVLCRIDADPTVHQHTEGAEDITESMPTFTPVAVDPKGLVALIPLSMEIVSDSPNLDQALSMALAGAFASKLDALAIAKLLADTGIPESESGQATDSWMGIMAAVAAALGEDQDVPLAIIGNAADWAARAAQRIDIDGEGALGAWLGKPTALANCLDLFTSAMTVGHAVMGDFSRGVGIALRQELRLEVIRFQQPKKASHMLVAHARLEPYVLQPAALFRQLASVI